MTTSPLNITTYVDYPSVTTIVTATVNGRNRSFCGIATCHPDDKFRESFGGELSLARALRKYASALEHHVQSVTLREENERQHRAQRSQVASRLVPRLVAQAQRVGS